MNRPVISFIIVCYNQELYIQEALEGAFAQTYSPLEIIVADDCSTDRSFEIIQRVAAAYKGPHVVRTCRTPKNVGIGGNINMVMGMCQGELVVGSAGDDVSLPDRTEVLYQAWEDSGRRATSIFSSYVTISGKGDELGVGGTRGNPDDATLYRIQRGNLFAFLSQKWPVVVGCTHAWSPKLFRCFGPLTSDLEDLVLSFRTLAIGELLYVHKPLIRYRRHDANVSFFADWDDTRSFEHREKRLHWVNRKTVAAYDNMICDIETLHKEGGITDSDHLRLRTESLRIRSIYSLELSLMEQGFFQRLSILAKATIRGDFLCVAKCLPRALPRKLYRYLYVIRERWRSLYQDTNV